jgi:O-antigen ligase
LARKKHKEPMRRPRADAGAIAAAAALAAVLAGTALLVDTTAAAAFDAPKRLIALVGTAIAAAAAFAFHRFRSEAAPPRSEGPGARRAALWLAVAALAMALVAALASPRRGPSLDATRALVLFALLLPLGASRVVERGRSWLVGVFLCATAVNAVVSILESRGRFQPFLLETYGDRQNTGAYAGNVGYLAITLALAGVVALGLLLEASGNRARVGYAAALALFASALVVNLNLTALTCALAGAGVLLVVLYRRRAALPIAGAVLLVGLAVAGYAPLRSRAAEIAKSARLGNWDALVSFRGGPWAAALEMTRERPLTGFGPGTFAAEYAPHRLAAEIRLHRRFVAPLLTSAYAETHCDYLQVFSDAGLPAGLLVLGAVACLFAAVGRRAWRSRHAEAAILLAVLAAGAAAALTWFPLQRPVTAVPLLLAAGRAWRISGDRETAEDPA